MSQSHTLPPSDGATSQVSGHKASVGYKHPPANKRFAKGQSGNPKGRPKGTPSVADILKSLFNKKVPVREANRVRMMETCEAIVRLTVGKARSGDARALTTILAILEKLGATKDVTSEERQNRTIKLARALTMEDYDLLYAPAREKERQYYSAIAECDEKDSAETATSFIRAGDEFAAQGKIDDALSAYSQQLALSSTNSANTTSGGAAPNDCARAAARIGLLADRLVHGGDFTAALTCAEKAISYDAGFNLTWIHLIWAHANMFLGRISEARDFYLRFQSKKNEMFTSWETIILRDFARFQKAGHAHPLMTEIEKKLVEAGWTAEGRSTQKAAAHTINADDQQFIMLNPEHVQTAALLAEHGKLDEAADVYQRNLAKCQARLAKEPKHPDTRQLFDLVIARLGVLAEQFVDRGRFATVLELTQDVIKVAPERYQLHAIRAHAMMFLGRDEDAQALYARYRGQKIGSELWEATVLADFDQFRQTGRSHPLMDKVERLFESKDWLSSPDTTPVQHTIIASETSTQADDIPAGDRLLAEGKLDEALEVYRRRIEISQAKLVQGRINLQAIEDRQIAIEPHQRLALAFALSGEFQKSHDVAGEAIAVLPDSAWPNLRRAHALMFLSRADEARTLYRRFGVGKATPELTWQDVIHQDFSVMRNAGLSHPLMTESEKECSDSISV